MNASMCSCNCSTPSFHLVEPRRPRRGEMEMDVRVLLQPTLVLLVSVEIVEDDVQLPIRKGNNDALHEAEELDSAAPLGMRGDDLPGAHLKSSKQGRGAVPLVIVALAAQGAPARKLQVALRPLQSLD